MRHERVEHTLVFVRADVRERSGAHVVGLAIAVHVAGDGEAPTQVGAHVAGLAVLAAGRR